MSANQFISIPVEVGEEEVSLFFALDSEGSCSLRFRLCPLVAFTKLENAAETEII